MEKSSAFLIDTQVLIWWMEKSIRLSKEIYTLINNPRNKIILSVASVWEMLIKEGKQKLKVPKNIVEDATSKGFVILPITISHVMGLRDLQHVHNDPFDRILISQAKAEGYTLISSDDKIAQYKIPLIKV